MSYSYSYKSSTGGSDMPRSGLSDDAEFQAAKLQAMMGTPLGGSSGGDSSYRYKSSSSTGGTSVPITTITHGPSSSLGMETEMARMKREMESSLKPNLGSSGGSSSYSYSSKSSSGATSPRSIHVHQEPLTKADNGSKVKKIITTTTTKTNPQAAREFESLERDFKRIGRTPDNYHDDFDKLKREVTTGEAYRGETSTHEPASIRVREEHLRGVPSHIGSSLGGRGHSETKTTTTRSFGTGTPMMEETVVKTSSGGLHSLPENRPHHHSGEVFIPVKTYDNTFDDHHMNRWLDHRDHFGSIAAPELDIHKMDWENKLRGMKTDMYKFSPSTDFGNSTIESSRTVSKKKRPLRRSQSLRTTRSYYVDCVSTTNPLGNPEFSVQFDMRDFKPEDINLSTKHGKLIINATHEDKIGSSTSRREFTRSVDLPADIQINMMRSVFSRDGVLSITAPIKPPHYDPTPKQLPNFTQMSIEQPFASTPPMPFMTTPSLIQPFDSSFGSQAHRSTSANYNMLPTSRTGLGSHITPSYQPLRSPTGYAGTNNELSIVEDTKSVLDFTLPVVGYNPEDIDVTVEGRKVKVHGKHIESKVGGRKTHNEFTKMFDLPADVHPENVRGYIKDGHTLHIVAHLSSDIQGAVHFIPVTRKW